MEVLPTVGHTRAAVQPGKKEIASGTSTKTFYQTLPNTELLTHLVNRFSESTSPEFVEAVCPEVDGDEGDVRVVHGLQLDASVRAVPCRLGEQVLQGLQHLCSNSS